MVLSVPGVEVLITDLLVRNTECTVPRHSHALQVVLCSRDDLIVLAAPWKHDLVCSLGNNHNLSLWRLVNDTHSLPLRGEPEERKLSELLLASWALDVHLVLGP